MRTRLAKTLSISSITGLSSAQTEELDLLFTYKEWNTDTDAVTDATPIRKRFTVHRSNFMHILETVNDEDNPTNRISFYAGTILLETMTTDDYDWFGEQEYTVQDINDLYNAIYSALQF